VAVDAVTPTIYLITDDGFVKVINGQTNSVIPAVVVDGPLGVAVDTPKREGTRTTPSGQG
jgi:DNA-binding beta-propeller fold protein YncE